MYVLALAHETHGSQATIHQQLGRVRYTLGH